jgi:hypothetical protein
MELKDIESHLSDRDDIRGFIKKSFSLSEDQMDTVEFLSWFIYYAERSLRNILIIVLKGGIKSEDGSYEKIIEFIIDKFNFTEKIDLYNEASSGKKAGKLVSYFRKINQLRNDIYHGRIEDLKYNKADLRQKKTRSKMMFDFFKALNDASSSSTN